MAKKGNEALVRKAVFVPPALWQRVKIEAAERGVDMSDIITEMLRARYESASQSSDQPAAAA